MTLPTSLYIHIPWCIRKCPYCDFNSHKSPELLPEKNYINALIADFDEDLAMISTELRQRPIQSIFIGGGTPSLFAAEAYFELFSQLQNRVNFAKDIEITLEANPGTVEQARFEAYRQAGINRLSLGIQSFNAEHLRILGRIHDDKQACKAIDAARNAGFNNINLDIMHSLPQQSAAQGLADLQQALDFQPEHLSWYQLTLEPNTVFYKQKPTLPDESTSEALETAGLELLADAGYERYEISAFSKANRQSQHNLNYWLFGDYYGIGAGAHGKITTGDAKQIIRTCKHRQPTDYLHPEKDFCVKRESISSADRLFEFMLNTTRLQQAIPIDLFNARTGLAWSDVMNPLQTALQRGLLVVNEDSWQITELGRRFTNDLQQLFLV